MDGELHDTPPHPDVVAWAGENDGGDNRQAAKEGKVGRSTSILGVLGGSFLSLIRNEPRLTGSGNGDLGINP
jgi:hypothetical protein